MTHDYATNVEDHYISNWGPTITQHRWEKGPAADLPRDFCVLLFNRSTAMTAYATRCMSQPEDEARLEIHLLTSRERDVDASLVELLTVTAHYHRTGSQLGLGHTVNFGRPWCQGSACAHGLLSLPYLDGPALEWIDEPRVRFLWVVPITPAELLFKKKHGLEALEQRFDAAQFDFLDPARASVV
jgi:hypothetical protein